MNLGLAPAKSYKLAHDYVYRAITGEGGSVMSFERGHGEGEARQRGGASVCQVHGQAAMPCWHGPFPSLFFRNPLLEVMPPQPSVNTHN